MLTFIVVASVGYLAVALVAVLGGRGLGKPWPLVAVVALLWPVLFLLVAVMDIIGWVSSRHAREKPT